MSKAAFVHRVTPATLATAFTMSTQVHAPNNFLEASEHSCMRNPVKTASTKNLAPTIETNFITKLNCSKYFRQRKILAMPEGLFQF